jgi:6-phosphogluconolactonase
MIKLFSNQRKFGMSGFLVSIIALGAIIALLATISPSSFAAGNPNGNAAGAIYILDNNATANNVWVYTRYSNGALSSTGTPFSTGGTGTGSALASQGALALTQNGKWLLAVDAGSNQITVFKVSSGSLVRESITSSHGTDPISLTVSNTWVYVLDAGGNGNIAGFSLNNGILTFIKGSVKPLSGLASPSPEQIGFSPKGNVLVVTEKGTNNIDTYVVNSNGVAGNPDNQTSAGAGPYGFAFTSSGTLVVSEAASNSASTYAVSASGKLRIISGAMPDFGNAPCWLVVNGNFVYAANAHGGTISSYKISKSSGLRLFSSVAAQTAIPTLDMAFSHGGHFLYVHNGATITGFEVHADGSISWTTSASGIPSSAAGLAAW